VGSAILDWVTGGSALATLGKVSIAVCALVLGLVYRRYLGILGADRRRPAERQAHDALRASLAEGNMAARLYARRLTGFLDWIDRFFGDAGMADRTLFPQAFGLRTPAPLWTAPAFDRCLQLALVYPIVTIFAIWAVSRDVGLAVQALHLAPNLPGWKRLGAGGAALRGELVGRRSTHYAGPPVRASNQRKAETPERCQRVAIKPKIGYKVAYIRRLDFD